MMRKLILMLVILAMSTPTIAQMDPMILNLPDVEDAQPEVFQEYPLNGKDVVFTADEIVFNAAKVSEIYVTIGKAYDIAQSKWVDNRVGFQIKIPITSKEQNDAIYNDWKEALNLSETGYANPGNLYSNAVSISTRYALIDNFAMWHNRYAKISGTINDDYAYIALVTELDNYLGETFEKIEGESRYGVFTLYKRK